MMESVQEGCFFCSVVEKVMADSTITIDNNLDMTYGDDEATGGELPDVAAIKLASEARLREMSDEVEKLKEMQIEVDKLMSMDNLPGLTRPLNISIKEKNEADNRSVYVGNVDYSATVKDLKEHFGGCGNIKRASILSNKFNGHPKGFAYIEFEDKDSVRTAIELDGSLFKGRQIKVMPKRTNKPGLATTNRQPRGLQDRGRSFRGGFSAYHSSYRPVRSSFSPFNSGYRPVRSSFCPYNTGYRPVRSSFSPYNTGYRPVYSSRDYSRSNYYSPYIVRRGSVAAAR